MKKSAACDCPTAPERDHTASDPKICPPLAVPFCLDAAAALRCVGLGSVCGSHTPGLRVSVAWEVGWNSG